MKLLLPLIAIACLGGCRNESEVPIRSCIAANQSLQDQLNRLVADYYKAQDKYQDCELKLTNCKYDNGRECER
jgi:hypothetical protein